MKKKLLYSICMMLFLLFSCRESSDQLVSPSAEDDDAYVTLTLDANPPMESSERLRAEGNFVRLSQGADGKPSIQFIDPLTAQTSGSLDVFVMILKGETVIYQAMLPWTIEDAGRRLSYKGAIKVKKVLLEGEGDLMMYASLNAQTIRHYSTGRISAGEKVSFSLDDNKTKELMIPFIMYSPIEQQDKTFYLRDSAKAKFKPSGVLVSLKIVNNLPVEVIPHNIIFCYDPQHPNYEYPLARVDYTRYGMVSGEMAYRYYVGRLQGVTSDFIITNDSIVLNAPEALGHEENLHPTVPPGRTHTEYLWLSEPQLEGLSHINLDAIGLKGQFTKVGGEAKEGRLLEYRIEFKPQDYSLNKGVYQTDNHGNVIPMLDAKDEQMGYGFYSFERQYFMRYGYTAEEIRSKTTTDDAWLGRYYVPNFLSSLHDVEQLYGESVTALYGEAINYTIRFSSPKPGLTEANLFEPEDRDNFARDLLKFERGGPLVEARTKAVYRRKGSYYRKGGDDFQGTFYMMRFLDHPEYRVFQRLRFVPEERSPLKKNGEIVGTANLFRVHPHYEVSLLPYDPQGLEGDAALTEEYWQARESQAQKIYISLPFATRNINPSVNAIHSISTIQEYEHTLFGYDADLASPFLGMAYWSNTLAGLFDRGRYERKYRYIEWMYNVDAAHTSAYPRPDKPLYFLPYTRF